MIIWEMIFDKIPLRSFRAQLRNRAQRSWPVSRLRSKRTGLVAGLWLMSGLAACSPIQDRTRDGLIKAGLSPKLATCMAKPMAEQLSVPQLRKLAANDGPVRLKLGHPRENPLVIDGRIAVKCGETIFALRPAYYTRKSSRDEPRQQFRRVWL
jgi:hypothetical protein